MLLEFDDLAMPRLFRHAVLVQTIKELDESMGLSLELYETVLLSA